VSFDYASIPPGYYFEAMLHGRPPQRFWHREKFLNVLRTIPSEARTVLDIGCAAGSLTFLAATHRPELSITGLDISAAQINFANERVKPAAPRSKFTPVEPGPLPFADNLFDVITSVELIEHLDTEANTDLSREVFRLLRPGGSWVVTTPNYHSLWPVLEVALNVWSPVKYNEQHLTKFNRKRLLGHLESGGWIVRSMRSFFVLSPFLAGLSENAAVAALRLESSVGIPGNLLIAKVEKP
jgi:2-polyprenyl-3-methyl-5-hydroxy-6-metoxy-1,4-benzoquinol methylase